MLWNSSHNLQLQVWWNVSPAALQLLPVLPTLTSLMWPDFPTFLVSWFLSICFWSSISPLTADMLQHSHVFLTASSLSLLMRRSWEFRNCRCSNAVHHIELLSDNPLWRTPPVSIYIQLTHYTSWLMLQLHTVVARWFIVGLYNAKFIFSFYFTSASFSSLM